MLINDRPHRVEIPSLDHWCDLEDWLATVDAVRIEVAFGEHVEPGERLELIQLIESSGFDRLGEYTHDGWEVFSGRHDL